MVIALTGCVTDPGKAPTLAQPTTPIVRTITSLSQAKSCMDQLLLDGGRKMIPITSELIQDPSQTVKVSTDDMIINAISDMTARSNGFEYRHIEGATSRVARLRQTYGLQPTARRPNVYIRGSISQIDNSVATDGASGAVTLPWVSLSAGRNQSLENITIDLQLANLADETIVPGMTTSNTITVISSGESQSSRGLIHNGSMGAALSISLSSTQREGRSQAVRTLLEYSLIELLGKYTHVPYHRCLEMESTNPATMQAARRLYDELDPEARTRAVQTALRAGGDYHGPVDGLMSEALQRAITGAKIRRGLQGDGRIDFPLFHSLYNENLLPAPILQAQAEERDPATTPPKPPGRTAEDGRDPFGLALRITNERLQHGDNVHLAVTVQAPARLYCYFQYTNEGSTKVARIFPNRFQPDNHVLPGQTLGIPASDEHFELKYDGATSDGVACIATTADYTGRNRPTPLEQPDLTPLRMEWQGGLGYPIYKHQAVDSLNTSVRKISF
ncbi:DUF4384 domain-containing protein [Azospirillum sp. RWY-5-1]|uniref:DUF4384 domain-containing protein n=1 Tax=Azospirillum oleiclasticum TaxID=2735135 RepID=A0ABX2TKD4_9PROT|nr:DUF4384 domain-containing protein [Azospirillum oleiclasticum]NYZ16309.1 DUF4384 domain-containing protein [Azospirillum oleiclasticum]NYZ23796.1 DUF4384 domain-containing protein [Azospirillum oleiclasticum]